uniref:Trichohyalin-plectin-homology domain-containing protein n=1 Tax=Arion vulgaris TaxID=1028688 RepID=A0A0B6YQ31_9EUPU
MATVMHGRRKGAQRGTEKNADLEYKTCTNQGGMKLSDGTDLRQVTVLSKQDWDRIERELNRRQIQNEMARQMCEEREEQKRKSKEIIKNWSNTIAGQRQKKLEARRTREEKEEEERKEIDLEEAKFQAQKRREALDKAKTQQYYQTDRVKTFHSALTLTEVLKERDAQLELKRLKELAMKDLDKDYLKIDREFYEKTIEAEQEKAKYNIAAAQRAAEFQMAQIQEHMDNEEKLKLEDREEGEELKRLTAKFRLEKEKLENMRKEERKLVMQENLQQIEDMKKIKQLQEEQEEEDDDECRVFAVAKRKMMKLRVEKEIDLHNQKQARLDRIKEKLSAKMKQNIDDEENRLGNAVQEIEKKRIADERAKEEKLLKEIREQAEHRNKQLKEKDEKLRREKEEEMELLKMRHAADELFRQNENEKSIRRRQDAEQLQNFIVDQYNERVNKQEEIKKTQMALDKATGELFEKEEEQFQEYARKVIDHCREKGRNVYPLERAAQRGSGNCLGVQMPNDQHDCTNATKLHVNGRNASKNRLGFLF